MAAAKPKELLILGVDDEPMILRAITSALSMAGFGVVVAEHGLAGLEAFERSRDAIDLVLADVVMPLLGGIQMAERIRGIRPDVPIVLMTAYTDVVISRMTHVKYPILRKPFLLEDLVRTVKVNINHQMREKAD
jgi:two-component system response regulator HydG